MSGLTQDNPQSNNDRFRYMEMVKNAIQAHNSFHSGETDNTITSFGPLYAMREEMDGQVGFGNANLSVHDRSGGFLPLVFAPAYYGIKKLFGGENQDGIHIDINSHKNEPNDDEPKGGEMKIESDNEKEGGLNFLQLAMPGYAIAKGLLGLGKDQGGMVLSPEAEAFHKSRKRGGRKVKSKKMGGVAITGADFSGADVINSEPLKNQGPEVGSKASIPGRIPNNDAGQGVQSWTEYPNKSLSNQDIKEATATTRDIENDFPVANQPSVDSIFNSVMKMASGKRYSTERSIGGAIKRNKGLNHLSKIPPSKVAEWVSAGRKCGGDSICGGELKKKIEDDIKEGGFFGPLKLVMGLGDAVSKISDNPIVDKITKGFTGLFGLGKSGGSAVASPDIDEGKRSPITPGINLSTQIDGYQDPRTLGMASQAGVGAPLGGKKRRNRKPMTPEQKKAFAKRMAEAKAKIRKQF